MRSGSYVAVALAALVVTADAAPVALADEGAPPAQVTVDQALALYRARSPRLRAAHAQLDAAGADLVAAGVLPNPSLDYSLSRTLHGTDTMGTMVHSIQLDWPLLIFGQRGARRAAAESRRDATAAHLGADFATAAHEIRLAFVTLLAAQERVRHFEAALADLSAIEKIVVGRANAGVKSAYDVERIKLEHANLVARADDARADAQAAAGQLAVLVGIPGWLPVAAGALAPTGLAADADALWAGALRARPDLRASLADARAAEAGIDAAEHERYPVPTLSVGALAWTDAPGQGAMIGVSVPLPLLDRGQGGLAQARAQKQRAEGEAVAVATEARAALDSAVRLLTARRAQLAAFERDVMQHLGDLRRMAEDAYRGGQGGILELLDAEGAITDAELRHVDLVAQVVAAEVDVQAAAGLIDVDYRP